jgi:hypothetical protein
MKKPIKSKGSKQTPLMKASEMKSAKASKKDMRKAKK